MRFVSICLLSPGPDLSFLPTFPFLSSVCVCVRAARVHFSLFMSRLMACHTPPALRIPSVFVCVCVTVRDTPCFLSLPTYLCTVTTNLKIAQALMVFSRLRCTLRSRNDFTTRGERLPGAICPYQKSTVIFSPSTESRNDGAGCC